VPDFDDTTTCLLDIPHLPFISYSQHAHLTAAVHIKTTLYTPISSTGSKVSAQAAATGMLGAVHPKT
jgi:hypothetical protein